VTTSSDSRIGEHPTPLFLEPVAPALQVVGRARYKAKMIETSAGGVERLGAVRVVLVQIEAQPWPTSTKAARPENGGRSPGLGPKATTPTGRGERSAAVDEPLERREELANRLRFVVQVVLDGPHRLPTVPSPVPDGLARRSAVGRAYAAL
jgi:hypothetical protein